ncbi:hypothetical protein [Hyphomonas sp.]|uniref:hypothetical protein n=1 Tax=Hyphomonas sp. TaxID=87 RepID=UPI0025C27F47|nr:hypothetical protein [Hyphomonas sp.]
MSGLERRLKALEGKAGLRGSQLGIIYICSVAPSPDGPVNLGPKLASILKGPHAGKQLRREDNESCDAFRARCSAMVGADL